jgi:hypothetical protein
VIGAAITQFQFSRDMVSERVIGLEVEEDFSYKLFSIKERIAAEVERRTAPASAPAASTPPASAVPSPIAPIAKGTSLSSLRAIAPVVSQLSKLLEGKLTYWIPEDSGYGYVLGQDNETYYLHFSSIADDRLRGILQSVQQRSRYPIEDSLEFEPGTKTKSSDKYPPAKNVRIATGKPLVR